MLSFLYRGRGGKEKTHSKGGKAIYAILFLFIFVMLGSVFFGVMQMLCVPLMEADLTWLYFALTGILATFLGIIGNIFAAQTQLYKAKDNELLLAMPIPPWKILFCRMLGLYLQILFFEALVLIPAYLVYWGHVQASAASVIFCILIFFLLPLLGLALSCILGWLLALITSRMRKKNLITVVLSLVFFAAYYYICTQFNSYLQIIIMNGSEIGETIRNVVYPLYQMGLAAQGNTGSFLLFALCILALFGLVYVLLSCSFLRITTMKTAASKIRYREKKLKVHSVDQTLLQKELLHLRSNPMYLLNCGLGSVLLLIAAVAAAVKSDQLISMNALFNGMTQMLPLIGGAAVCILTSMNLFTAPSISLEAKTLWLLQSLPVSAWKVLQSKIKLHLWLTLPCALLCMLVLNFVFSTGWLLGLLTLLLCISFALFCAVLGLAINLKMPKLDWTNEIVAVKQSGSTMVTMFVGWVILIAFVVLGIIFSQILPQHLLVLLFIILLLGISVLLLRWLKKKGAKIFQAL